MKYLLPSLILTNCLITQVSGVLEWTVVGKVTEYGQNVTLFCNVSNCCPKDSGWERWTPVQQTLFIDIKTGRPNKKYDGKVLRDGYTLIIQNLTEKDLNVSYSCLYGVTLGEIKFLLEEDVFTTISTAPPNVPTGNSKLSLGQIASIITGITMVIVLVVILIYFRIRKNKKQNTDKPDTELPEEIPLVERKEYLALKEKVFKMETFPEVIRKNFRENEDHVYRIEKISKVEIEQEEVKQKTIKDHEGLLDLKEKVVKLENEQTEVIPENIRENLHPEYDAGFPLTTQDLHIF